MKSGECFLLRAVLGNFNRDDGNEKKKTPLENITFFDLCYFAIISIRSTCTKMANYPSTKLVGTGGVQVEKENEKFTFVCSRSPQNLEFDYFALLFCRRRQRNITKLLFLLTKSIVLRRCRRRRCKSSLYSGNIGRGRSRLYNLPMGLSVWKFSPLPSFSRQKLRVVSSL